VYVAKVVAAAEVTSHLVTVIYPVVTVDPVAAMADMVGKDQVHLQPVHQCMAEMVDLKKFIIPVLPSTIIYSVGIHILLPQERVAEEQVDLVRH